MFIKPQHKHVDSEGEVYLPYLHDWRPTGSTLLELVKVLCHTFSQDPPLYAKPAPTTTPPPATTITPQAITYGDRSSLYDNRNSFSNASPAAVSSMQQLYMNRGSISGTSGGVGGPATTATAAVSAGYGINKSNPFNQPSGGVTAVASTAAYATATPAAAAYATPAAAAYYSTNTISSSTPATVTAKAKRSELIERVTQALQAELAIQLTSISIELDRELDVQNELEVTKVHVLPEEEERLRQRLKRYQEKTAWVTGEQTKELDAFIASLGGESAGGGEGEGEAGVEEGAAVSSSSPVAIAAAGADKDRLQPFDEASAQYVKLLAEQNAIDDTIYYLDYAIAHGVVNKDAPADVTMLLKEIRKLSRKQFLCKVHLMKMNNLLTNSAKYAGSNGNNRRGYN